MKEEEEPKFNIAEFWNSVDTNDINTYIHI